MRPNPGPGKFVVVEGLDGAGTTTQARLLGERMADLGPVWVTWEPSDRPAGLLIRRVLAGDVAADPRALALLFAADRLDHVYGPAGIAERLRRGVHVVCDRYYLSSLAYQTLSAGFSWVHGINRQALRPDLTVFLEVPVCCCLERIGVRQGERKELFERQEALDRVRRSYYRAIGRLIRREYIQIVDGCGSIPHVADLVWDRVQALFDPALYAAPRAQRRLARAANAPYVLAFRRALEAEENLCLRGVRRLEGRIEAEVDTPTSCGPLRVRFWRSGEEVAVEALGSGPGDEAQVSRLEELARRALEARDG